MKYIKKILLPFFLLTVASSGSALGGHGHVDSVLSSMFNEISISESSFNSQSRLNVENSTILSEEILILEAAKRISKSQTGYDYKFKIDWEKEEISIEDQTIEFKEILEKAPVSN